MYPLTLFPIYLGHTGGMSQITIFPGLRADSLEGTVPYGFINRQKNKINLYRGFGISVNYQPCIFHGNALGSMFIMYGLSQADRFGVLEPCLNAGNNNPGLNS